MRHPMLRALHTEKLSNRTSGDLDGSTRSSVRITTGVKLRGPEGAQRPRATPASTSELSGALRSSYSRDNPPVLTTGR